MRKLLYVILLIWLAGSAQAGNLLENGDFEEVSTSGFPVGWYVLDEGKGERKNYQITFQSDPNVVFHGKRSAAMIHSAPEYSSWVMLRQDLKDLKPGKYVFSGNVRWTSKSVSRPCVTLHLIDKNGGLRHPMVFSMCGKPTPEGWVQFRREITIDKNVKIVGVNAIATDGPAQVYVDDLGFWAAEDAPVVVEVKPEVPPTIPVSVGHPMMKVENATAHVQVKQIDGVWYLVKPGGESFFDLGMNHCSYPGKGNWWDQMSPKRGEAVRAQYPTPHDWEVATAVRLRQWGFTSLGAWSYPGLMNEALKNGVYFWVTLGLSDAGKKHHYLLNKAGAFIPIGGTSRMANPFDPQWQADIEASVMRFVKTMKDPSEVIGFFPDNEISLGVVPLSGYIAAPSTADAFVEWLKGRYSDITSLNKSWEGSFTTFDEIKRRLPDYCLVTEGSNKMTDLDAFEDYIVETYVDFTIKAIRQYAPNALICSPRLPGEHLAGYAPLRHFAKYDIIAVNSYGGLYYTNRQLKNLRHIHEVTGRPLLISEWTVGATDQNHSGIVQTQAERATVYCNMIRQLSNEPYLVAMHYQMWFSPESGGNQYGMVTAEEKPFENFTETVAQFQRYSWKHQ